MLRFDGPVRSLVDEDLAPDVLAVLGEALSNAGRHADASSVEVLLAAGDSVVLTVTDDGRGLPADVAESGLGNMRRRAQARGGTFEVSSGPDSGTRLGDPAGVVGAVGGSRPRARRTCRRCWASRDLGLCAAAAILATIPGRTMRGGRST
ncbi:MAG: hypothetical protein JJE50_08040 [Actinomycetales bacterium]|nr:hypothetical protein [Actinomycetales bacterium]